jgi:flagellar hook protein FlgE
MPHKKQPQLSNFDRSKLYIEDNNHSEFKKLITEHPGVLSERNSKGKGSPLLHLAIENNNLNAVKTILEQAKLKNILLATTDKSGKQALDLAKEKSVGTTKKASPIHDIYKLLQNQNTEITKSSNVNNNEKHTLIKDIANKIDNFLGRALDKVFPHEAFPEASLDQSLVMPSVEESIYQAPANLTETMYFETSEAPTSWEELAEEGKVTQVSTADQIKTATEPAKNTNAAGNSVATTKVKLGITLNAEAEVLKGNGEVLSLPRGSASNNDGVTGDDLIVPSDIYGAGRIQIGDVLAIRTIPPGREVHFKYGGIATSNQITSGILGATIPSMKFNSASAGDSFRINFGDDYATFKYKKTGIPNAARGEFNTLETLAKAINSKPGLKAKISDSKLHIGTVAGIDSITFTDLKGSFVKDLEFSDIPAEDNRFSTMNSLKAIMNKTEGLVATLSPEGGIDFYNESPTGTMKVHGISVHDKSEKAGTSDSSDAITIYTTCGSNIVRVYMPNHGKDVNEVFTFKGILSAAPIVVNNVEFDNETSYIIKSIGKDTTYGDYFEYCTGSNANYTGFDNSKELQAITVNEYSRLFKELGLSELNFDFGPSYYSDGGTAGQNLAEGTLTDDSVYTRPLTIFDDLGMLHDFRVSFAKLDHNIWGVEIYAAKNIDGSFDIVSSRKDGQIAAGTMCFNGDGSLASVSTSLVNPIKIAWSNGAPESNVTFNWGTAGVPRGTEGATVFGKQDGMRQVAAPFDQRYIDQDGGFTTTDTDAEDKNSKDDEYNLLGQFRLDKDSNLLDSKGEPLMAWKLDNEGRLPEQVKTDNLKPINTKLITGNPIATSKVKLGITLNAEAKSIPEKVYSENLAEETITHDSVFVRPLTVYDSLGVQHNLRVAFAKLGINSWAAEIYAAKNEDGTVDIETKRSDGQIAAGILKFNGDGSLAEVSESLSKPIEIIWKNYAFNSSIEFDWGTAGVPRGTEGATVFGKQDGMRQVAAPFDQRFLDQDGVQPGVLRNVSFDEEGYLIASFSNGGVKKLFKLPLLKDINSLYNTTVNQNDTAISSNSETQSLEKDRVSALKQDNKGNIVATYEDGSTKVVYSTPTKDSNVKEETSLPLEIPSNNEASETQATNPLTLTTCLNDFIDTKAQKTTIEAPKIVEDKVVEINELLRKSVSKEDEDSKPQSFNEEVSEYHKAISSFIDNISSIYATKAQEGVFDDKSGERKEYYKNLLKDYIKNTLHTFTDSQLLIPEERDVLKAFIEDISYKTDHYAGKAEYQWSFLGALGGKHIITPGLIQAIYNVSGYSSISKGVTLDTRSLRPEHEIPVKESIKKWFIEEYAKFKVSEEGMKFLPQTDLTPNASHSQELKLEQEKEAKLNEHASNEVDGPYSETHLILKDPLDNVFPVGDIYVRSDEV